MICCAAWSEFVPWMVNSGTFICSPRWASTNSTASLMLLEPLEPTAVP